MIGNFLLPVTDWPFSCPIYSPARYDWQPLIGTG
jgi:hypothetical protein